MNSQAGQGSSRFGFTAYIAALAALSAIVTATVVWYETSNGYRKAMFQERARHLDTNAAVIAATTAQKLTHLHRSVAEIATSAALAQTAFIHTDAAVGKEPGLEDLMASTMVVTPAYTAIRVFSSGERAHEVARITRENDQVIRTPASELATQGFDRYVDRITGWPAGEVGVTVVRRAIAGGGVDLQVRADTPIFVDERPVGSLAVFVDIPRFLEDVFALVSQDERFYLSDASGRYVIHPDANTQNGPLDWASSRMQSELPATAPLFNQESAGVREIERFDENGRIYTAHILGTGPYERYVAALSTPTTSIHALAIETRNRSFFFGGILIALMLVLVAWASKSLTRPLRHIEKAALALGQGQGDVIVPLGRASETENLARAFNQMRRQILERTNALEGEVVRRQNTEDTLRSSEERYRSLVWATAQIVLTTNNEKCITERQPSFESFTGLQWDAYCGDLWWRAIYEEDRSAFQSAWNEAGDSATVFEFDTRVWHAPSNRYHYVEFRAVPLRDHNAKHTGWVAVMTDRHDQHTAAEQLRLVVESAPNGQVIVDAAGAMTFVNAAAERLFGYKRVELLGKPVETLIPERFRSAHVHVRQEYQRQPEMRAMGKGRDLAGVRKDGSEFPIEVGLSPIESPEGILTLCTVVDITDRVQNQLALERYARRLESLNNDLKRRNRELDEFTYVASHDLQEPLRKLITFSGLIREDLGGDLTEDASEDLRVITEAAKRMQTLVQDLLALSRSGRAALRRRSVDLAKCLSDARDALHVRINERNAQIIVGDLPNILGDYVLLTQLMQNLISNAIKFNTSEQPVVEIGTKQIGDETVLFVQDNGIGIAAEYSDQIFAPFKRLHGRHEYEGTGIGLAVCRKIVERHGGRIWVDSTAGQGACFYITLSDALPENEDVP